MIKQNHSFENVKQQIEEFVKNGEIETVYDEDTSIININYDSITVEVIQYSNDGMEINTYTSEGSNSTFELEVDIIAHNVYTTLNKHVEEI